MLAISTTEDLLAFVPYLLEFHPHDSLVMIAVAGPHIVIGARGDLPAPEDAVEAARSLVAEMFQRAVSNGAQSLYLIGYGPAETVTPVMDAARSLLPDTPVQILDMLRVDDGRYFSYLHPHADDDEGVPFDVSASVVAVRATIAGHIALPDRATLVSGIEPVTGPAREAMDRATVAAANRLSALIAADGLDAAVAAGQKAVTDALAQYAAGQWLDDDQMAWLTVHLMNSQVRSAAWLGTDDKPWQERLWTDATRRAVTELVAPAAALLAFAAWRQGRGALALVALQRALEADPADRMAVQLARVIGAGLPPSALAWPPSPELLSQFEADTDPPQQQDG